MNSRSNYNSLFLLVHLIWNSVGDCQVLTLVSSNSSAKSVSRHIVELSRLNFTKIFIQICVSVWLGVGEIHLVIVVLKSVSEGEGVVASLEIGHLVLVFFVVVLEVAQVLSASSPSLLELEVFLASAVTRSSFLDPLLSLL